MTTGCGSHFEEQELTVAFRVWFSRPKHQQHRHQLGTRWKCTFLGFTRKPWSKSQLSGTARPQVVLKLLALLETSKHWLALVAHFCGLDEIHVRAGSMKRRE